MAGNNSKPKHVVKLSFNTVPQKVDTGIDGNLIPLHLHKNCFLGQQNNCWWQQKITSN